MVKITLFSIVIYNKQNNQITLGLFALVEILRVKSMDNEDGKQRFQLFGKSLKMIILAGRFFAECCDADPIKTSYGFDNGFEDADIMQATLDRLFPKKYNLTVYKHEDDDTEKVYEGNKANTYRLGILWYKEGSTSEYFGLNNNYLNNPPAFNRNKNRPKKEQADALEDILEKYWKFKVYGTDDEYDDRDVIVPAPYHGDPPFPPLYRQITKKEFEEDRLREYPFELIDMKDKIVRTSVNCDEFGNSNFLKMFVSKINF